MTNTILDSFEDKIIELYHNDVIVHNMICSIDAGENADVALIKALIALAEANAILRKQLTEVPRNN